ncbi:hypothetical protein vseg_018718 [Gypsophila vaccaria]
MVSYYSKLVVIALILLIASVPTYGRSTVAVREEAEIETQTVKKDVMVEAKRTNTRELVGRVCYGRGFSLNCNNCGTCCNSCLAFFTPTYYCICQ